MANLSEIFSAQTEQRRAVELGVAADIIVRVRVECLAFLVVPDFSSVVLGLDVDGSRFPVVFLARHEAAAFEQQNLFARRREPVSECPAARARANNDQVVMVRVRHTFLLSGLMPPVSENIPVSGSRRHGLLGGAESVTRGNTGPAPHATACGPDLISISPFRSGRRALPRPPSKKTPARRPKGSPRGNAPALGRAQPKTSSSLNSCGTGGSFINSSLISRSASSMAD